MQLANSRTSSGILGKMEIPNVITHYKKRTDNIKRTRAKFFVCYARLSSLPDAAHSGIFFPDGTTAFIDMPAPITGSHFPATRSSSTGFGKCGRYFAATCTSIRRIQYRMLADPEQFIHRLPEVSISRSAAEPGKSRSHSNRLFKHDNVFYRVINQLRCQQIRIALVPLC